MSVPAFIPTNNQQSIASAGIKMIQQVVKDNGVQVYYADGSPPVTIPTESPTQRDIVYNNLVSLLNQVTSPTAPTITSITPDTLTDVTTSETVDTVGTNFLFGWLCYFVPTGDAPYANAAAITGHAGAVAIISPVYDSEGIIAHWTIAENTLAASTTYDVCYIGPDDLIAWLEAGFTTGP